jgi:hypothetical protein
MTDLKHKPRTMPRTAKIEVLGFWYERASCIRGLPHMPYVPAIHVVGRPGVSSTCLQDGFQQNSYMLVGTMVSHSFLQMVDFTSLGLVLVSTISHTLALYVKLVLLARLDVLVVGVVVTTNVKSCRIRRLQRQCNKMQHSHG